MIGKEGIYGDIAISGDNELTAEKDGAAHGEILEIRVWQKSTNKEYSESNIRLSSPPEGKAIYVSYPGSQLHFEGGIFYLINIEVDDQE